MKRKKSIAARLGIAAFALTLVTTCMTGGTLAKYVSEVEGTGTAVASKWVFKAGTDQADLKDSDFGTFTLASTKDTNVNAKNTTIAPGDTGKALVYYDLTGSEVAATVNVYIKITDAEAAKLPDNLELNINGTWTKISAITKDSDVKVATKDLSLSDMSTATAKGSLDIGWRWEFGTSDDVSDAGNTADTANGKAPTSGTINVKVTGEQKAAAVS